MSQSNAHNVYTAIGHLHIFLKRILPVVSITFQVTVLYHCSHCLWREFRHSCHSEVELPCSHSSLRSTSEQWEKCREFTQPWHGSKLEDVLKYWLWPLTDNLRIHVLPTIGKKHPRNWCKCALMQWDATHKFSWQILKGNKLNMLRCIQIHGTISIFKNYHSFLIRVSALINSFKF